MTDTGHVPAEGPPESAATPPEEPPGSPASGAYVFAEPAPAPRPTGDDEDLLMPSTQGAWTEGQGVPVQQQPAPGPPPQGGVAASPQQPQPQQQSPVPPRQPAPQGQFPAPDPATGPERQGAEQTAPRVPQGPFPGPHETDGRDTGSLDVGGPVPHPGSTPPPAAQAPRRPLHLGPPVPEQSGAVRPLSERTPAPAPQAPEQAAPEQPAPGHVPQAAPVQTPVAPEQAAPTQQATAPPARTGLEYLDGPEQGGPADPASQGNPAYQTGERLTGDQLPGPQLGELPPQREGWAEPQGTPAEAVPHLPEQQRVAPPSQPDGPAAGTPAPEAVPAEAVPAAPEPAPLSPEPVTGPSPEPSAHAAPPAATPEPAPTPEALSSVPTEQRSPEPVPEAGAEQPTPEPVAEAPAPEAAAPPGETPAAEPPPGAPRTAEAPEVSGPIAVSSTGEAELSAEQPEAAGEPEPSGAVSGTAAPDAAGPTAPEETATADAPDAEPVAAERGAPAPGFADDERAAVHRLMRERRDIRNGFRADPIPHEVLLRVLEAAHTAPSVGHSQPWDFVVIRSEETRRAMHELAQRQREAYAQSLPKARAKQFKELKVEAILDTPVNIVVTADPTRGGRHTLGRHTQPQMAPYSSALAVENLWLAARAEGLGVGWVSFFDEREMVRALELPEHLEVVAYLCVGYVDEFPPEPELAQAGWSKRRPLSWVVHEESYGRRALPGAEPHDLLAETLSAVRPLDAKALGEAWERQKRMTKPAGALGVLEIISAQLCGLSRQCPPPVPEPAAVAVFAGDHGVHAQGVTPWPQEVTGQMVANFLGGGAVCNAFASQVGAEVCVIDVGVAAELPASAGLLPRKVRAGTDDMTAGPALSREETVRAIEVGIETARDLVAAGNRALLTGEMGIANTTASAALIAACTGADAAEVTGRGTGVNDETHARKVEVVRRALELHQPDPSDPVALLAAVGGLEHAALVGLILGGASLRTPVILDGVSAGAAALVARALAPEALSACVAGHRSAEPGHVAALTKLGLRPLVDLDLRLGEGTGALLALPLVQSAARAMHEVATFDAAGVTEKN
ncbi:nicotinate-nucleotide--dimethylbenzimidazole phosphoribosyltransferase [Streptomyces sp. AJS327]|uniref:nicotinate-nucleotide--dimethylbenzimidazole phosphoribosyltransferase n=1 Tax=Streptomyces sp. AJS327 TaxID=2545265 RepID=UPI0015DF0889|nr:nicotinate-nucleotide--dimethylbenzimidazole phosphoribosyltransferase [Streptomyces sp. AJS327]MBA0050762.1 nicotinate-nucleotide--dimethylbenzimidazole phosphoribosyltransferase [Streptomyces sp. AJS327]